MPKTYRYGARSLRFKLALTSIVVELVMLALLIANSVSIATDALEQQTRFRVNEIVPLLNASIARPLVERDYATLDEILLQVVRKEGIEYISVSDVEKRTVSEVGLKENPHNAAAGTSDLRDLSAYGHLDFPILLVGEQVGVMHLSISTRFLDQTVDQLKQEGFFIAAGEVVLTFVLLVIVGVLLTRNLAVLADAARTMSEGDLSVRINSRTKDEVGAASRAFDVMAQRLESLYKSLKSSEQRYQTLTEVSPVGIFNTDAEGKCVFVNERMSDITGIPREEYLGLGWQSGIFEEDREQVAADWTECVREGRPCMAEFRLRRNTGGPVWVFLQAVPVPDDAGVAKGYVGTVTDITRRKQAEQDLARHRDRLGELVSERTAELQAAQDRLIQQERLATLGQLTATVSHELRNPLGIISNAVYYLKRKIGGDDAKVDQYLDMIAREVGSSNRIICDLLETSRTKTPILQWVNLDKQLEILLKETPLPEGIHWRYRSHPQPFYLRVDPQQLRQVLHNLILNSVQAMGGEGRIELDVCEGSEGYELRLSDSGPGIGEEDRKHLFEPLYTTKAKGNGLGLWISREIVRRHGGELTLVESHLPGASFLIRLPRGRRGDAAVE